ncbi:hypothetical protein [Methyloversatilis discipulorum]|uniref:hypothetical protein n=1 Tax=Methyloversatilis discipulorum TaxID=1119528 RepID=UPI00048CACB8|nr:hypothetical protein [Methyloversatilis discipulorum]
MLRATRIAALILPSVVLAPTTHAARPMVTDDARIVDPRSCQLETWTQRTSSAAEYWLLPSCAIGSNFELILGGARTGGDGAAHATSDRVVQGKTLLRTLANDGWGLGLVAGGNLRPTGGDDAFAYVPATFAFADGTRLLHLNAGWLHDGTSRRSRATWGIGGEVQVSDRLWLIGESYGEGSNDRYYQLGLRLWLIPNRVQLDATHGNRWNNPEGERWISIGLRLLSPAFLP